VEMAHRVGALGVLVRTGYGRGEEEFARDTWNVTPDHIADDIARAVGFIESVAGHDPAPSVLSPDSQT
ncbi:MAG: HAD hydrolase-like protein, partial [Acidobacteriota bacterium]